MIRRVPNFLYFISHFADISIHISIAFIVVEVIKLMQIGLGEMYLLVKSKGGYSDERCQGGDAAH